MTKFLTPQDLIDMTGLKQGKAQCRWLQNHRPPMAYALGADGHPRVLWSVVEQAMGVKQTPRTAPGPDLETLEKLCNNG